MRWQAILAAVDGSAHADAAVDFAAEMAKHLNTVLIIFHAIAPIYEGRARRELGNLAQMEHHEQTEYEILQDAGRDIVAAAEARARKRGASRIEPLVEVGDPAKLIVDLAKSRKAKMIVLGRRGRGELAGLIFGSVSHKVIQISKCAVLVVP